MAIRMNRPSLVGERKIPIELLDSKPATAGQPRPVTNPPLTAIRVDGLC
jgi:hypothetical protein